MIHPSKVVSIHPYFKIKAGKLGEAKTLLEKMVVQVGKETAILCYDFTLNGDVVFCREAYVGAEGLLHHAENIGPLLGEFLKVADILRVELHGAPEELAKLKGPLAGLKPECFEFFTGLAKAG